MTLVETINVVTLAEALIVVVALFRNPNDI